MIWAARVRLEHRDEFTATLRERFHCSWRDAGGAISWADMVSLVRVAYADRSTRLGAAVAGWAYPASMADLALIAFAAGEKAEQIMPASLGKRIEAEHVEQAEREAAEARLIGSSAMRDRM